MAVRGFGKTATSPHARIAAALARRLSRQAKGDRWQVSEERFARALGASADHMFAGREAGSAELERYLRALHLEDVALACACADGNEDAWEHFVREYRPALYRAADALDPSGGARDLADSLHAELFGLKETAGERQSLFRYYHGRSSLATWLRAVLSQRFVDRLRTGRRVEALPDEDSPGALASAAPAIDLDRDRHLEAIRRALERAVAALAARDRLRLACYYADDLTLAQTGRALREHEATVSRRLARTRRTIRQDVERRLRDDEGLDEAEVAQCFECAVEDAGALDLQSLLGRKE